MWPRTLNGITDQLLLSLQSVTMEQSVTVLLFSSTPPPPGSTQRGAGGEWKLYTGSSTFYECAFPSRQHKSGLARVKRRTCYHEKENEPEWFCLEKRKHIKATIRCVVIFLVFSRQINFGSFSFSRQQVQPTTECGTMIMIIDSVGKFLTMETSRCDVLSPEALHSAYKIYELGYSKDQIYQNIPYLFPRFKQVFWIDARSVLYPFLDNHLTKEYRSTRSKVLDEQNTFLYKAYWWLSTIRTIYISIFFEFLDPPFTFPFFVHQDTFERRE